MPEAVVKNEIFVETNIETMEDSITGAEIIDLPEEVRYVLCYNRTSGGEMRTTMESLLQNQDRQVVFDTLLLW